LEDPLGNQPLRRKGFPFLKYRSRREVSLIKAEEKNALPSYITAPLYPSDPYRRDVKELTFLGNSFLINLYRIGFIANLLGLSGSMAATTTQQAGRLRRERRSLSSFASVICQRYLVKRHVLDECRSRWLDPNVKCQREGIIDRIFLGSNPHFSPYRTAINKSREHIYSTVFSETTPETPAEQFMHIHAVVT